MPEIDPGPVQIFCVRFFCLVGPCSSWFVFVTSFPFLFLCFHDQGLLLFVRVLLRLRFLRFEGDDPLLQHGILRIQRIATSFFRGTFGPRVEVLLRGGRGRGGHPHHPLFLRPTTTPPRTRTRIRTALTAFLVVVVVVRMGFGSTVVTLLRMVE